MKYFKTLILSSFTLLLMNGCRDENKLVSRGFEVRTANDSTLNIWDSSFHMALTHPSREVKDFNCFLIYLKDSIGALYFDANNKTGEWDFGRMEKNKLEGKVLRFDQYQAVTEISWFHNGDKLLTLDPDGGIVFENIAKAKSNHISKPHILATLVRDSFYRVIIEQSTYPIVWGSFLTNNKVSGFRSDLISNTSNFNVSVDSLPLKISIKYKLKDGDNPPVKSYEWNSATDSVVEVKVFD